MASGPRGRMLQLQGRPLALACACIALLLVLSRQEGSTRTALLAAVGVGLGLTLFQSTFGFAGSFRAVLERRDWSGFRAQAVALAACSVVFFPLLAQGEAFGMPLGGFGSPVGISFLVGAVLFGIGMQIGGGCASGTLFILGGGQMRLLLTLAFFIVGSVLGAATLDFWWALPAIDVGTAQDWIGWPAALAVQLVVLGLVFWKAPVPAGSRALVDCGPGTDRAWPLAAGAVLLAVLNGLTLVLAGRPWGETSGFTLWGSKLAAMAGFAPASWPYWSGDPAPLTASVFADVTSVMDFGIIAGACLAAAASGRFALRWRMTPGAATGAVLGGLLMGYGARLSGGCNIGAYFSALASGSLSGWVWPAAAFAGSFIGLRLRRLVP